MMLMTAKLLLKPFGLTNSHTSSRRMMKLIVADANNAAVATHAAGRRIRDAAV